MFSKSMNDNKSYFVLTSLLCCLVYALNYTVTISQCAMIFASIVTVMSLLIRSVGQNRAKLTFFVITATSMALLYNMQYYINDVVVSNLVFASLASLYISVHGGMLIASKMKLELDFKGFVCVFLVAAGTLDAVMMSVFFVINSNFSYVKILSIFAQEVSYKSLYALAIYGFFVLAQKSKFVFKQFQI